MDNKYTGTVDLELGDKTYLLVYDWEAIAQIKSKYGQEVIQKLYEATDPDIMADVVAIGLKRNHPEMTTSQIKLISPPIIPTISAVDKALAYAYFGSEVDTIQHEEVKKKQSLLKRILRTK